MTGKSNIQERLDELSSEKLYLGAIRSLLEDDRFVRYLGGMRHRYEVTSAQRDALPADEAIAISEIKGVRRIYAYEIALIENAPDRIKIIDEELSLLNKQRKSKNKGNEGTSGIVPPKG